MNTMIGVIKMLEFILGLFIGAIVAVVGISLLRIAKDENDS